jgi:hypothetical protein
MTVAQLLKVLETMPQTAVVTMPQTAVVLIEGDAGFARVGEVNLQGGSFGMPDEVLLSPDMSE